MAAGLFVERIAIDEIDEDEFTDEAIRSMKAQDTGHWQFLRGFLDDPHNTLDALLQE